jgi:CheY-like chemotaxis protein
VQEAIEEMVDLLASSTPKKIAIRYDFAPDLPLIEADASQIRQVMLNLITNATEAIGDREGTIHVTTASRELSNEQLRSLRGAEALAPGRYVVFAIRDDGCGMDGATLSRFLEPFFSTKFSGRGLGLAAVEGIVRTHGGAIRVASTSGEGTLIEILLPALAPGTPLPSRALTSTEPLEASGTILLVDDEADVRDVGATLLSRAGFDVLTAVDGVDAVGMLQRHDGEVACVLLDLTMPKLDGSEAVARIRAVRPDLPVIICSGYPEKETMERFADLGLAGFLQKPYTFEALMETVQRALAGSRG